MADRDSDAESLTGQLRQAMPIRLERLALHTGSTGADRVGAVAVGTGVGAGVFMTLLIVVLTHFGG